MNRDPCRPHPGPPPSERGRENVFRPLVVGVMFGCIAVSAVGLVRLFFPAWNGTFLVVGCVLAALEANYSYRLIRARHLWGTDRLRFRAIELALFFVLLKIGGYVGDPWTDVLADVQTWPRYPHRVVDPETAGAFVLAFLSWQAATETAHDFQLLGQPPETLRYYVSPGERLAKRFFQGGAVLLVITGVHRIGIESLLDLRRPSVHGLVLADRNPNVLIYFLLGLVMLGQVHFTRLRQQWRSQEITMIEGLAGRWVRYSLAFIGLVALLAFLLPTGYTVGLLDAVARAVSLVGGVLWFILMLLMLPLAWLLWVVLALLSRLFGGPPPARPDLGVPELPQQAEALGAAPGWFEVLRSLVFWAVALGMVVYVIRTYLRDHPEVLEALTSRGPIRALRRLLSALWRRLVGLATVVGERLPRRLSLRRARSEPREARFRFFRLGALAPRERILYYYLSVLRRAGQQGIPRGRSQTPYEYDGTLGPRLTQAEQEMRRLTEAFVEARYSRHPFDREQDRQVRTLWQRVKAALRALKQED